MSGPYTFNVNNPNYHSGMHVMQDTQSSLARLGRIFGPNKYEQVNATDGMPITIQTIQDYYSGANKYLATTIIEALPDYDSWHFRCCPLVKANGLERRFKTTLVFESHLPDSRAPFGTVNRISSTEETTEWRLEGAGIGLRFEYKYLMSEGGELYMQKGMNVIARSICDYHKLAILGKMLATPLPPRCRDLLGQPYQDIGDMMTGRYARMFGTLSKHPRAYYKLVDWMRSQQARASLFESSMLILPFGARALVAFGNEGDLEANRSGEARANRILTQGADSMPTVHGVTPYEETEYPFANDANRKITKPMERTAQVGWHYISSPKLEHMANPKYNETLCRSFQALDLSGDVEWKTHKFADMIFADRNFDQKTGMLKADLLAPLEGSGYETQFTQLGLDLKYTPNKDAAVHPYITVTNGIAKIIYFWGDMDTYYAPEHYVAQLGIANAKAGFNSTHDSIDYSAIEYIFDIMDKAANVALFSDGPTMEQGFIAAAGMDYRNTNDPNSLFARRSATGGNFPPLVNPNGDVSIYTAPATIEGVYQAYDPVNNILAYSTNPTGSIRVNIGLNRSFFPGFSTIADLRQLAGSTMYDPQNKIAKGLTEYSKFVEHVRNAFSSDDAPNLMLNPDLCPAHIKVPGNSDYAKKLNIESAFMTAFGRTRRPVAIRHAYSESPAGAITALGSTLISASRPIANDRTGIDDLAAILGRTDIVFVAGVFDDDIASEPLLAQLKERGNSLLVTKFEGLVEEDPRKAGLQSAKAASGGSWLNAWITLLKDKGLDAPRITRALNRLVEYLVEHPDKNINRQILQQFATASTPDEDAPATEIPGKRKTRREDLERAQTIADVTARSTRKTISLSLSGNVFEGLTNDQLQASVVIPVSPFDARETPDTTGMARVVGNAGNYEASASSMENTIFGNHDLAFADGLNENKRERMVGGAVFNSRRIIERSVPNTRVQSLYDLDGDEVGPSGRRAYPVELAQHGLENRFFAQKLNYLNSSSLSLFQRAYASLYLGLQLNSKVFCKLAENNYTVPMTYLALKPFITLRVGSAIGCSPDLGITETDFSTVMINVDPEILALNVNTTFESGVGILEPRKLFVMDAVMFLGYEGGSSPKPIITIDSASLAHRGRLLGGKTPDFVSSKPNAHRNGDVFYLSVAPVWNRTNLPKALDVAGPLDHILFNASTEKRFSLDIGKTQQVEGMVTLHMETNLQATKPAIVGALDSFISIAYNSENRVNTLTSAGGQMNYNIEMGSYTLKDSNGTGPLGNIQAGTAAAIHGEPALTEPRGFEISVVG